MNAIPSELVIIVIASIVVGIYITLTLRADRKDHRAFRWWLFVEDAVNQILIVAMLATSGLQVVARFALSGEISVPWTEEFARLVLIWQVFWAAAALQRLDGHISMSIVYDRLPPKLQLAVRVFGDLVTILVLAPIVWLGWQDARALDIMSTVSLGLPLSIFAYSIPLTGALMIAGTLRLLVDRVRGRPDLSKVEHVA
jgi:TRAP-type C4-dicarboxylate transport system permease small subunit